MSLRNLFIVKCIDEDNFASYRDRYCVYANVYKNAKVTIDMIKLSATTAYRSIIANSVEYIKSSYRINQRRDNASCNVTVTKLSTVLQMKENKIMTQHLAEITKQ